jgi:hypothetical protein
MPEWIARTLISHDLRNKYSLECLMPEWIASVPEEGSLWGPLIRQGDQELVYQACTAK